MVVWSSRSGTFCSGRDSRQTVHGFKGPEPGLGTKRRKEGTNQEDYETKEEARE